MLMHQTIKQLQHDGTEVGVECGPNQRIFGQILETDLGDNDFPAILVGREDGEQYVVALDKVASIRVRKDPRRDPAFSGPRPR